MVKSLKKLFNIVASIIIVTSIISCASDNSPKPQPMPVIQANNNLKLGWTYAYLSKSTAGSFAPTIFDNAVFTADSKGKVYKFDPSDGSIINEFNLHRTLTSGTGVSAQYIFVTSRDGYLLAVSKVDGSVAWQAVLPTISIEAPQVADNIVIVRTNDSQLLAYDANSGSSLWIYQKPIPPLTLRVTNSYQIIGNEVVVVGQSGGKLSLLNLKSGIPIWDTYIALPNGATDLDKVTDIAMRPVLNGRQLCVASYNGKIACLDAISSSLTWDKSFSSAQGLIIDEQNVYAISADGVVTAFMRNSGAIVWQNTTMRYRDLGIPALFNNSVVVPDSEGYIHFFNRNDGTETDRLETELKDGISYPIVRNSSIIYQSANGEIAQLK